MTKFNWKDLGIFDKDEIKEKIESKVKESYPIESANRILQADSVEVGEPNLSPNDWGDIKDAILEKKTIGSPVSVKFTLKDKATGKKISTHKVKIGDLPEITRTGAYIVDGAQYTIPTQLRLKAGAYGRIADTGDAEVFSNIENGSPLRTQVDPIKGVLKIKIRQSHIPLYPILKTLGVNDEKIRKSLGNDIYAINKDTPFTTSIARAYKSLFKESPESEEEAKERLSGYFHGLKTNPDVNEKTLGTRYKSVNGEYLLDTAKKVIGMTRREIAPDNRDALEFKNAYGFGELIGDRIKNYIHSPAIKKSMIKNMGKDDSIANIVNTKGLKKQFKELVTTSELSKFSAQPNPVAMLNSPMLTTLLGEGGINNTDAVSEDAKILQNSHMGFIDASHTPESHKAGITLTLSQDTRKRGQTLQTKVVNLKTGKIEWKTPQELSAKAVAFPKEFEKKGTRYVAQNRRITVIENDERKVVPPSHADYMIYSPKGMFDLATNTIPFSHSNQGNRLLTGAKMAEQVISLANPEIPLVEVESDGDSIIEDIGREFSVRSNVAGRITKITPKYIYVETPSGNVKQAIFDNIPLNDHALLDSKIRVSVGDTVKKGDLLADSNFTKDGKYVSGVNLNTAYIAWKGHNFEDGQILTESGAKKLSSVHLHKLKHSTGETDVMDIKKYKALNPYSIPLSEIGKYTEDGVIKKGTKVKKGDVIVAGLRENSLTGVDTLISSLKKTKVGKYKPHETKWTHDANGVVTDVFNNGKEVDVYIKTIEPAQVGDKFVGRHGNKGTVGMIIPDDKTPITESGEKVEMILAPESVPPRINVGQTIETAAGKLAAKTGKQFKVSNYSGKKYLEEILQELKKHGIKEKEDIFDPESGTKIPKIFIGKQYIQKLKQTVDTKISARGISGSYTSDNQPTSGGGTGGQAVDRLTTNALLAYNARDLVKEMTNVKNNSNDSYWRAIQHGELPPAPKTSFEWEKFKSLLKTMGINTVRKNDSIKLTPLTDTETRAISNGEIKDPRKTFVGKGIGLTPDKEGLFGSNVGGMRGNKFNHLELATRIPSPSTKEAIKTVLHLTEKEYMDAIDK